VLSSARAAESSMTVDRIRMLEVMIVFMIRSFYVV